MQLIIFSPKNFKHNETCQYNNINSAVVARIEICSYSNTIFSLPVCSFSSVRRFVPSFLHCRNWWLQKVEIIFQAVTLGYIHLQIRRTEGQQVRLAKDTCPFSCPPRFVHSYTQIGVCRCMIDAWPGRIAHTQRKSLACGKVTLHHGIHRTGPCIVRSTKVS